jgi:hypothetical protein
MDSDEETSIMMREEALIDESMYIRPLRASGRSGMQKVWGWILWEGVS